MALELHPEAASNLNRKAAALVGLVRPIRREPVGSFRPQPFVAATISESEMAVRPRQATISDGLGNDIGRFFAHAGAQYGLLEKDYAEFASLVAGMQRTKGLVGKVSVSRLATLAFEWLEERYKQLTGLSLTDHVLARLPAEISRQEIWVPVANLYIESEFSLGQIAFKTLSRDLFDRWLAETGTEPAVNRWREDIEEERRKLQGLAAATVSVEAEPERARELAYDAVEDTLALLRFFSPANHHPKAVSYCTILGKENEERAKCLTLRDERLIGIHSGVLGKGRSRWVIDTEGLAIFRQGGLGVLDELLRTAKRSAYQERLYEALLLYSRSCLAKEVVDKLVYLIVPLESMLLRNESEPVQYSISERVAFLIGKDLEDRKRIIRVVKKAYGLRSGFLHHGEAPEDLALMQEFMDIAWRSMHGLLINAQKFTAVEALLDAIENRRLT